MCWAAAESELGPLIALEHFECPKSWSIVIPAESIDDVSFANAAQHVDFGDLAVIAEQIAIHLN
jgi:hypothetical protein